MYGGVKLPHTALDAAMVEKVEIKSLASSEGFKTKKFHTGNGVFASTELKGDCEKMVSSLTSLELELNIRTE